MTQDADVQGLQSKAESRLASLKNEKLVTRIAVVSTLLGPGKITKRLMIGMSVETHKTSPDFDHEKCGQAKSRIMRALDDIDCDVFIEMIANDRNDHSQPTCAKENISRLSNRCVL